MLVNTSMGAYLVNYSSCFGACQKYLNRVQETRFGHLNYFLCVIMY